MKNKIQDKILKKIKSKKINIGIVGVGYVGLNLLIQFAKKKIKMYGFDNDEIKINSLKRSVSPILYIKNKTILDIKKYTDYEVNYKNIEKCDVIIICLPTPLDDKQRPDLSHIKNAILKIKKFLKIGQTIVLESTSYPGTTKETITQKLQNFNIGKNFFIGYSPERENPGSNDYKFSEIPKIVSGHSNNCLEITDALYKLVVKKTIKANQIEIAETSKIFENIYRSVNIALVNELKFVLKKMNIDINEVIDLAKTKPFGFSEFRPGPGVGGHCIPIDPLYLAWIAEKNGYKSEFIRLASQVNLDTTKKIYNKIKKIVSKKKFLPILILGLAYKKNIEDTREAAGLKFFQKLLKEKFKIDFLDDWVKKVKIKDKTYNSINLNYKKLKKYSAVIVCTDHDIYDYKKILKNSKIIIDLRNRYKIKNKKIIKI
jgi:UDP-N-acetyl-D-glucosamine dehydrogenase|tara:strand:- start:1599 stop:2885 length:1287 start_codon:yes stop_codon:yes gene_type:complete